MTAIVISLVAAALIAMVCGLFCHFFIHGIRRANIVSVIYSVAVFNGLSYAAAGSLDPYWYISSIIVALISYPIVMLCGTYIQGRRAKKSEQ